MADNWPDVRQRMQEEARTSTNPVSAFFLLTSPERIPLLVEKLRSLLNYGITDQQIQAVAELVADLFRRYTHKTDFQEHGPVLGFTIEDKLCSGRIQIRNAPGHGFEVELGLPGIVAANTPEFLGDGYTGFWTAFMPPAFYD